ncbi:MAG: hypothetical protein QHH74_14845 [Spirochaetota bacterium]|nr:hypothetical protein [Spirochaetota bacterium]
MKNIFKKTILILFILPLASNVFAYDAINAQWNVNIFWHYGFCSGNTFDHEKDSATMYVVYSDGSIKSGSPKHYLMSYGIASDYLPFKALLFNNDNSAIRFGFRAKADSNSISQKITVGDGDVYKKYEWKKDYMSYYSLSGGVVVYLAPYVVNLAEHDNDSMRSAPYMFTLFATVGTLLQGKITPYPIVQSEVLKTQKSYSLNGVIYETGMGFEISAATNRHIGCNVAYNVVQYNIDSSIKKDFDYKTSNLFNTINIEIYAGITF